MGQTVTFKYRIAVKDGKAINQLIIDSSLGSAKFGNDGVDVEISKSWSGKFKIFEFRFPPMPVIYLALYAEASLGFSVKFTTILKTSLQMTLTGSIGADVSITAGADGYIGISAGAEGTIITASGYATVTNSGISKGFTLSGGAISVYVKVSYIFDSWKKSHKLFDGWTYYSSQSS